VVPDIGGGVIELIAEGVDVGGGPVVSGIAVAGGIVDEEVVACGDAVEVEEGRGGASGIPAGADSAVAGGGGVVTEFELPA
jgi:hypothetical protein